VTPLIFSALLQNLVVNIGGEEGTHLGFSKVFQTLREKILVSLVRGSIVKKVKAQKRLVDSKITTEEIEKACKLYGGIEEFAVFENSLSQYSSDEKRIEHTRQLL
jgi:hypothetical protein